MLHRLNVNFGECRRAAGGGAELRAGAASDYKHLIINRLTSTPHQPANACLVPSLLPNVGENGQTQASKFREIKGLSPKSLFLLSYWNR